MQVGSISGVWVYGRWGHRTTCFSWISPAGIVPARNSVAATELCPVRNRLLIGEVHDDNAWFAGGVDGHAGLFGTAEALFRLLRCLVAGAQGGAGAQCDISEAEC
jgi:hypothetical protein